jgi:hypothetical protein
MPPDRKKLPVFPPEKSGPGFAQETLTRPDLLIIGNFA